MVLSITSNESLWVSALDCRVKIGCNAHIVCRQYILYLHYGILEKESFNKKKERERKQENLKQLRRDLTLTPENVKTEIKCHISLPTEEAHHKIRPPIGDPI